MRTKAADIHHLLLVVALCTGLFDGVTFAVQPPAGPIAIDHAAGQTGQLVITMSQSSPLSKPAEIVKRLSLTGKDAEADYDLSKHVFDVYVPREPGEGGKYGLMVLLAFGVHTDPPRQWPAMLEKYHLIWIAARNEADDRPALPRVAAMLDGVYNAQKTWPIDDRRVYACLSSVLPPLVGLGYCYPEVFPGSLHSIQWQWFNKLTVTDKGRTLTLNATKMPRPSAAALALARVHSRFFLADRTEEIAGALDTDGIILEKGFKASGFKYAMRISVPQSKMPHFPDYAADWFEQGIQYLDAPLAQLARAPVDPPAGKMSKAADAAPPSASVPPAAQSQSGSPPQPPADDAAAKAGKTLSVAKSYIAAERYDAARTRLQNIVSTYPGTPAAQEAKDLLKQIEGK